MGTGPLKPPRAPQRMEIRPKPLRTVTRIPTGPKLYRKAAKPTFEGGPGEPPPGFVTPTTSKTEWLIYWAIAKIFKNPRDPRIGPFMGGPGDWEYQSPQMGGRSQAFGSVVDFLINPGAGGPEIIVRLPSERFHFFAGPQKIASDEVQLALLSRKAVVVDLNDFEFTHLGAEDLVIYVKRQLGLIRGSPITSGTARRNSR